MVAKQHSVVHGLPEGLLIQVFLFLSVFLSGTGSLLGQKSPYDPAFSREAAGIYEKVECFTDRSLYICGEKIRFRANVFNSGVLASGDWSTVLYVELISAEGEPLTQGKYPLRDRKASGNLRIPDHLLSGTYYLRSYTRWMRNRDAEHFSYVPLRIINPERPELVGEITQEEAGISFPVREETKHKPGFGQHPAIFERGDTVSMDLMITADDLQDSPGGCLTVVPYSARPADLVGEESRDRDAAEDFQLSFLPDRFGPSLSGTVSYPGSEEEVLKPARIHLTLMGDQIGYFVCRSDASGRFVIGLPARTGELEFFVQPESQDGEAVEVRIDQDFDPRMYRLPVPPFALSQEEARAATIMSRNVQLTKIYSKGLPEAGPHTDGGHESEAFPFYGTPTRSVDLDLYVLLPTLKEVFLNLVPGVTPVTRRNRTTLQIHSVNPSLSLYAPLVMIDQVPVMDMDKFMAISPAKIKSVDVIEDVYVKGDLRFGGVINLRSREQDMAGIDLPENSFFIDYQAMHPSLSGSGDHSTREPFTRGDRVPDTRNTLLWIADLKIEKGNSTKISFVAPDYPGDYLVLFRGQNAGGELVVAETKFRVR